MKRALFVPILLLACTDVMEEQAVEIMGGPSEAIPRLVAGLSDGRAVIYFSDGYERQVKLIDPQTGSSKDLNLGSKKSMVMAMRVGWGDTIFVVTVEGGTDPTSSHLKLHEFTPQGVPRGKHVLKNAEIFMDFLVAKGDHPKGSRIMTLNMAGPMSTVYDRTGKILGSAGPRTGPEGPYLYAWMALVPAKGWLLVIPRSLRSDCVDCPNYIEGPIRVYGWIGGGTATPDSFPLIRKINLDPLLEDADAATVMAARGDGGSYAYVFLCLTDFEAEKNRMKVWHVLVKIDPSTDPEKYEIVKTTEYEELYWGDDGRLYNKEGEPRRAITCADISKEGKLFLAYGDGHVEVCDIQD